MLVTVDQIREQATPILQALLADVLFESNDLRPLLFGDEQEFKAIKGIPFPSETNACFAPFEDRFIIFVRSVYGIGHKEEDDIAHELGHLWMLFLGLPSERKSADPDRQKAWDTFFSPLRDIMEHAVYYPLLKDTYGFDLYTTGNQRLAHFIENQLPGIRNNSEGAKLLLMLNYIKYEVESDDHYWLQRLHAAYSKRAPDVMEIANRLLDKFQGLAGTKDVQLLVSRCRDALVLLNSYFRIPKDLWPDFLSQ